MAAQDGLPLTCNSYALLSQHAAEGVILLPHKDSLIVNHPFVSSERGVRSA